MSDTKTSPELNAFLAECSERADQGEISPLKTTEEVLLCIYDEWLQNHKPEGPLLQCVDCHNTESPAGAMARYFNQGRCLHCGGYFKVVRA